MILTDEEILIAIDKGEIVISPYDKLCLGTNSYDVHLSKYLATYKDEVLDARKHNEIDHFEIERSLDNDIYVFRGVVTDAVKINEQQSFNFTDDVRDINTDVIYYRLKVIGKSGAIKYSNIVVIRTGSLKTPVTVMPNPVKDYVTMQFFVEKETKVTVSLVSETGKTVLVQNYSAVKGNNTIMIKNLTAYGAGLYSLQLVINNEVIARKLLIVK